MRIERGTIYAMAERGPYTGKPRPVVVIQNPNVQLDSVIVIPLTSFDADGYPLRIAIDPTPENGLQRQSFAMSDKITTMPRANLGEPIGQLSADLLREIHAVLVDLTDEGAPLSDDA